MPRTLAVVPCSAEKAWDDDPTLGPALARDAYTSRLHRAARRYAARHADGWVVLSALHGFLAPGDVVPGPYDVTFERPEDPVVSDARLASQAHRWRAERVIVLCPDDYAARVRAALAGRPVSVETPLQGLTSLEAMAQWLEAATRDG